MWIQCTVKKKKKKEEPKTPTAVLYAGKCLVINFSWCLFLRQSPVFSAVFLCKHLSLRRPTDDVAAARLRMSNVKLWRERDVISVESRQREM